MVNLLRLNVVKVSGSSSLPTLLCRPRVTDFVGRRRLCRPTSEASAEVQETTIGRHIRQPVETALCEGDAGNRHLLKNKTPQIINLARFTI